MARYEIFKKLISQKITFSKKENRVIFGKQSYSNTQEKQEDSKETKIDGKRLFFFVVVVVSAVVKILSGRSFSEGGSMRDYIY